MTAAKSNVSSIPAPSTRKPRKRASVAAREAEAVDGFLTVEHLGITLRIPGHGEIPIAVIDMFRDGDNYGGTRELIGAKQWKALSDAGMTRNGLDELAGKLREAWGN